MNRYTAPLGFTLIAIWVLVISTLIAGQTTPDTHRATKSGPATHATR